MVVYLFLIFILLYSILLNDQTVFFIIVIQQLMDCFMCHILLLLLLLILWFKFIDLFSLLSYPLLLFHLLFSLRNYFFFLVCISFLRIGYNIQYTLSHKYFVITHTKVFSIYILLALLSLFSLLFLGKFYYLQGFSTSSVIY